MHSKIENHEIIKQILEKLKSIIGYECFQVKRTYGGAYYFDFGAEIKTENSRFTHGEWWINTSATHFILRRNSRDVLINTRQTGYDEPEIVDKINRLTKLFLGQKVSHLNIDYDSLGLLVKFDGGAELEIIPTIEDDECNLPYWEVSLPNGHITVGSNRNYTVKRKED